MPDGLVSALQLNGAGAPLQLSKAEALSPAPQGLVWLHFNYKHPATEQWLEQESGLTMLETEALLAQDTRPRVLRSGDGLLLALRGINLNPGADPEDMVSIRIYVSNHRIITTSSRDLLSVKSLVEDIINGAGPVNSGGFLLGITERLTERNVTFIDQLEERLDELEERLLDGDRRDLRTDIAELRRQTVVVRRYLAPQREAFSKLLTDSAGLFDEHQRLNFNEINDTLVRGIEDLDSVRERATVAQEELQNHQSEAVNQRLYFLSLISAIFLPLGFLTGLLGVNIAGIPGAETPWAFAAFCGGLMLIVGVQLWFFYRHRWL
ncbi:magnesium transporter CorA [Shewanella mangrovi]|uniref:Magnesium transporter CorA n=1 Tax=Shewanella mangrovi TaxID=1515746 RepID=A0A094JGV7_9GAMM|nr:zinc transporter ZntB [Shewanella mangrovi]KFZ39200.1 magnesium transporter CorA [Shewanella mangrovi]